MFWAMCRNVDRIRAERDLRSVSIAIGAAAANNGDVKIISELQKSLISQMGTLSVIEQPVTSKEDILKLM